MVVHKPHQYVLQCMLESKHNTNVYAASQVLNLQIEMLRTHTKSRYFIHIERFKFPDKTLLPHARHFQFYIFAHNHAYNSFGSVACPFLFYRFSIRIRSYLYISEHNEDWGGDSVLLKSYFSS